MFSTQRIVCLSTDKDKAAYPINAMEISKAMMEKVIGASARVAAGKTTICCTRYGNVMCSRGSVIPLEHGEPGNLFVQKSNASTIGDLAKAVQKLFGDTGTHFIGTRHGEKLFETLMTNEECVRSQDMGDYYRVLPDGL